MAEKINLGPCANCGNDGANYVDDAEGFTWHLGCFQRWKRHRRNGRLLFKVVILAAIVIHIILIARLWHG